MAKPSADSHTDKSGALRRFAFELKARGVLKVATAYLASCWLILEIGHTLFEIFELPHVGLQAIFVLLTIGFPATLAAAWYWRFAASAGTSAHFAAHNEAAQVAIVFGAVALVAVAIAIGVRFFGFGHPHPHAAEGVPSATASVFAPPPHSVAVMSFMNLSGNANDEYFSDGLSEELLDVLARIKELRVAARTSSFSFKHTAADIPTVGRQLNVGTVLEGSVRKAGEQVRITAQLINAVTGFHEWSQTYDRDLKDIFALQSEIATSVASALKVTLLGETQRKLTVGGTQNPQAHDAYLRSRYGQSIQDEAGLRSALASVDKAVELDPGYAQAHAFRAEVLGQLANIWIRDKKDKERLSIAARIAADKAVELAPESAAAYAALGSVLSSTTTDYGAIDAAYRRSLTLEPGNAQILNGYASYAAQFGRPDALLAAQRAVSLDPLKVGAQANLGVVLFYAHRFDEARTAFREADRLGTNRLNINWMGMNELAAGKPGAALGYCERDLDFWYDQMCLAMVYHDLRRKPEALAMLARLKATQGDDAAYQYAQIYATWGDTRQALQWLSKAAALHDPGLLAIKTDPFLNSIRQTAEFKRLVVSLNLPS